MNTTFSKKLSKNDLGMTGSHQAGMCVPKNDAYLLNFFPYLDPKLYNPNTIINCIDSGGRTWEMRYIYYNGKLHSKSTRNEYRITRMTKFLRYYKATERDSVFFTNTDEVNTYKIYLKSESLEPKDDTNKIVLRSWRRIH